MKLAFGMAVAATGLALSVTSAVAQEWRPKATSGVNSTGFKYSGFYVEPSGSGCRGGQNYVSETDPKNKGFSATRFTTATKADGGIVCSGGTWYYGPGDKQGQAGGSVSDILIKSGRYYTR